MTAQKYGENNVVSPLLEAENPWNHICAKSRVTMYNVHMKKFQLTEDMAQYRKYWITQIMAGPAQGDGQDR